MTWFQLIASALLGGGLVGGLAQILAARNEAKRVRQSEQELYNRQPLFAMEAAERSVAIMVQALDKADKDIKELEATIHRLQEELQLMRTKYSELQTVLHDMQNRRFGNEDV